MTLDYPLVRASTICPLCQGAKDTGLVACWPCFRKWDMRNGTMGADAVIAVCESVLADMIHHLHTGPHPNTDECTAACNNAVPGGEGYFVEWNGESFQSVFPSSEADKSQLHVSIADALDYMADECGVDREQITVITAGSCFQAECIPNTFKGEDVS